MNWDDLKVALAVSRHGSLTRAAEALAIDQATAARRLGALEAALGTLLFVRSRSGLTPTEAGRCAINRALEVELRLDRLTEDLARGPDGPVGLVRLVGNGWMLERLADRAAQTFLAAHPHLDLRLITSHPQTPVRVEATVSLWFEAPPRDSEFAIQLGEVPYAVYAAVGSKPAALPWLSFFDEDAPRRAPARALERIRKRGERLRLTSSDARVLLAAARAGVGKGILPMCLAEGDRRLARVGSGPPDLVRILHLHMHPDTVQALRVQAVVRWLRETVDAVFGSAAPVASVAKAE